MENKVDNFKRIASNRTNKIIETISSLSNLSNTSYYEYTEEEINKIFDAIIKEAEETRKILLEANINNKKKKFTL